MKKTLLLLIILIVFGMIVIGCSDVTEQIQQFSDYWGILYPPNITCTQSESFTTYCKIYIKDVTDAIGPGANINVQFGMGPYGTDGSKDMNWTWTVSSFNMDQGNMDEYKTAINSSTPGNYSYSYRFSYSGNSWLYVDIDGSDNGYSVNKQGYLTVLP